MLVLADYLHSFFNNFAALLETVLDESFWQFLLGQRWFGLVKRYIGNDAVMFGIFLSLGPTILSLFTSFYYRIKSFVDDLFHVSIEITAKQAIYMPVHEFIKQNFKQLPDFKHVSGVTMYSTVKRRNSDHEEEERVQLGLMPHMGTLRDVRYKGHKLWVSRFSRSPLDRTNGGSAPAAGSGSGELLELLSGSTEGITISMRSRDLGLLQSIVQEWIDEYYRMRDNKLIVYKANTASWSQEWEELCTKEARSFDSVILKKNQKEELLNDVLAFRSQKEWFAKKGIPYRRGYLLYGPPGTGKTSFIQSLAAKVDMNVALISITAEMDDDIFTNLLVHVPKNTIVVMEDVDHCTINDGDDGDGSSSRKRVTATGMLNALDGVYSPEGCLIFLTCNDMTKIVPALLRPGRVDVKMMFGYADKSQIEAMFWRFFDEESQNGQDPLWVEMMHKLLDVIPEGELTPAELQNFFMAHAMLLQCPRSTQAIDITRMTENDKADHSADDALKHKWSRFFDDLLSSVPPFMEKVKLDREQARKHQERKSKKQSGDDDD